MKIFLEILTAWIIVGLLFPNFAFFQNQPITPPKTLNEAETIGEKILNFFPQSLKIVWQETLIIWEKMIDWFKNLWYSYILPLFGKEVEKRKPEIQEEFKKEKKEMKEEIPKISKSLWERFKDLIK